MLYKKSIALVGLYCLFSWMNSLDAAAVAHADQIHKAWVKLYDSEITYALNNGWIDLAQAVPYEVNVRKALRASLQRYLQFPLLGAHRPTPYETYGMPELLRPQVQLRSRL